MHISASWIARSRVESRIVRTPCVTLFEDPHARRCRELLEQVNSRIMTVDGIRGLLAQDIDRALELLRYKPKEE